MLFSDLRGITNNAVAKHFSELPIYDSSRNYQNSGLNSPCPHRHSPLHPQPPILLLSIAESSTRQLHGVVNGHGQSSMPTSNHHCYKDELAQRMPAPAEAVRLVRQANTDSNTSIATICNVSQLQYLDF